MFHFLNPAILFALVAGLIPIIIHLLNRQKYKEVPFSTIHFLKEMVRKEVSRLKIRQIILLILRTLIILLLILAFARPTLRSQGGFLSGKSPTEVVIVLDNSLSMNSLELTGNSLEMLRQWWFHLEEVFDSNDRISVILGVEPLEMLAQREPFSDELWKKVVKNIQPSVLRGNLNLATLKAADIFLQSDLSNRELYFISDFQESGMDEASIKEVVAQFDKNLKVFFLPVIHRNFDNVSVDSVRITNQLIEKNQTLGIQGALKNQNDQKYLNSMVSVIMNGERLGQENLNIPPSQIDLVEFDLSLNKTGYISGYLETENDVLLEDNRYFFNFFIPNDIHLLHIVPDGQYESFVPAILKPALNRDIFNYQRKFLAEWSGISLNTFEVIILEGLNQIPAGFITRLEQFHRQGKGICIIPGDQVAIPDYNRLLDFLKIGNIAALLGNTADHEKYVTFGDVNWQHPIFEGLFVNRAELNPVNFYAYYRIRPYQSAESIIEFQNGDNFLLANLTDKGSAFLFSTPLQPEWTNLLIRGFVVPLVYRTIYYTVTKSDDSRKSIFSGESFQHSFGTLSPPYQFRLVRPSGQEEKISPVFRGSDVVVKIDNNQETGNYQIYQGNKLIMIYSVNHSPQESMNRYFDKQRLEEIYPNSEWVAEKDNLTQQIEKSRFGRELWPYLLGLVMILLFAEMILAYTGSFRQPEYPQNLVPENEAQG